MGGFTVQRETFKVLEKTFMNWWKIRFSRRKLSQIACFCSTKGATPPNFAEETFVNSHKTMKFVKVLSLESFPLYGTWDNQINKKIALAPLRINGLTFLLKDAKESLPPPSVMPRQLFTERENQTVYNIMVSLFQSTVTSPQLSVNWKHSSKQQTPS